MTTIATFTGVTKWYGPVIGVNDIRVTIGPCVTGLVGTNGAGKTTLIKLLTGHLQPSLGTVTVCGHSAWSAAAKRHIGYCPEVDTLYDEMSGRQFRIAIARLHGLYGTTLHERVEETLSQVGMLDRANRRSGARCSRRRHRPTVNLRSGRPMWRPPRGIRPGIGTCGPSGVAGEVRKGGGMFKCKRLHGALSMVA